MRLNSGDKIMILVIPSIEIAEGASTVEIRCDDENSEYFDKISSDPLLLSQLLRKENAKCLHIIDSDSFAKRNNLLNIVTTLYLTESIDIPIQYAARFSSIEECRVLLNSGVYRVVIDGDLVMDNPKSISKLISDFTPSRVAFQADVSSRFVYFHSMQKEMRIGDYIEYLSNLGANRAVYSCDKWRLKDDEPDYHFLEQLAEKNNFKITIADGITSFERLNNLKKLGSSRIDSCIIGKPLYENIFPCQKIWREAESEIISNFL